jgi:deoxycytidylate deaminase
MENSTRIRRLIDMAIKESQKSSYRHKVGVIIVKGSRIISKGYNDVRYKSTGSIKYSEFKESRHAERDAVSKLDKEEVKGTIVFIGRGYKNGEYALAAPCDCCLSMLIEMKVKRIIFSIPEEPYYAEVEL